MHVIMTRKVDELGRIVLPQEIRREFDITTGAALDVCVDNDGQIVLRKTEHSCKLCGATENLHKLLSKSIFVCSSCRNEISGK